MTFNSVLFLFLALFIGCAHEKPTGKTEAEVLYKEALQLKEDGHYLIAIEKLNKIKSEHPYSFYATPAELLNADIYFLQESYVDASAAYLLFRDFHPRHEKIDYVIFKIAESYYMQMPDTFDRDLASAHQAIRYYNELKQLYPTSEHIKDTNKKIDYCEEMIRQKEKYIADFYFKTKVYQAARFRYLDILKSFRKEDIRVHAMIRTIESSIKMSDYKSCVKFGDEFIKYLPSNYKSEMNTKIIECKKNLNKKKGA
jgi:outer membrane protein assembly factor BamD